MTSRRVLDAQIKESARLGLVKQKKRASAITLDQEEKLWTSGALGSSSPVHLVNSLIYFFGIHFSLRAAQEQRDLEFGSQSQIVLKQDDNEFEYLEYTERVSKNRNYGLKSTRHEPKQTRLYSRPDKDKCSIELYKKYLSHRPKFNGHKGHNSFYVGVLLQVLLNGTSRLL